MEKNDELKQVLRKIYATYPTDATEAEVKKFMDANPDAWFGVMTFGQIITEMGKEIGIEAAYKEYNKCVAEVLQEVKDAK